MKNKKLILIVVSMVVIAAGVFTVIKLASPNKSSQIEDILDRDKVIQYLDLPGLLVWNEKRIKMAKLDQPFCASVIKGGPQEKITSQALSRLDPQELKELSDLIAEGFKRKASKSGGPEADPRHVITALKAIEAKLPDGDKQRFMLALNRAAEATEAEACWASLQFMNGLKGLDDTIKMMALKALSQY